MARTAGTMRGSGTGRSDWMAQDIEALFAAETELLGLKLMPGQAQSLLGAYAALREMVALVGADHAMAAEPAHVFVPDAGPERRS